jgi:hypothetical protein
LNSNLSCGLAKGGNVEAIFYLVVLFALTPIPCAADDSDGIPKWLSVTDDRLIVGANGATVSGAGRGAGGSASWVEDLPKAVVALTADYQTLGSSRWGYGAISVSFSSGSGTYYAEINRGAGENGLADGNHHFAYDAATIGAGATIGKKVSLQLETRQIDIDTAHGNLPKATFEYLWLPGLRTSATYARSVTGNLGTKITALGLEYDRTVTWLAGAGAGHVSPPIVNLESSQSVAQYRQAYVGISTEPASTVWSVVIDHLRVGGIRRTMLSVTCSLHPQQ